MSPFEAQQRINAINAEIVQHEQAIMALRKEITSLVRIAEGFDNNDAHFRAEMQRYQEKMASWDNGSHPWLQSQKNARQEAEAERQRAAQRKTDAQRRENVYFENLERVSRGQG